MPSTPGQKDYFKDTGEYPGYRYSEKRKKPITNIALFVITVGTVMTAGVFHASQFIYLKRYGLSAAVNAEQVDFNTVLAEPSFYILTAGYTLALIVILGAHEMGHYLTCRRNGLKATLPFFIPGFPPLGTFGAFIKIKSRLPSRKVVFDVGIAGPLTGFIVTLPVVVFGLINSLILTDGGEAALTLGEPLLMKILEAMIMPQIPSNSVVYLHPLAFAGWIGLFATGLNLLPVGQLDGGHIAFSVFGDRSRLIGAGMAFALIPFVFYSPSVMIWMVFFFIMGFRHPPTLVEDRLGIKRKLLAAAAFVIFILSFVPVPVHVPEWTRMIKSIIGGLVL